MKKFLSQIIAAVCVVCVTAVVALPVFADNTPSVSVSLNSARTSAEIRLSNVGVMIYSAQLTLNIDSTGASYTVNTAGSNTYGTAKTDGRRVTVYIDSDELMDGSSDIVLGTLDASGSMSIATVGELTLVDRSMRPIEYSDVNISVSSGTTRLPIGGIGNIGGISGSGIYRPNTTDDDEKTDNTAGTGSNQTNVNADVFTDIEGHWARDYIKTVVEKGLFNGMSDTAFEPDTGMTRAMYVTVLSRFGTKIDSKWQLKCDNPMSFGDIPDGEWYSEAVAWAGGTGIVNGIGDNMFGPSNLITREQIAVMTVNFANLCGAELTAVNETAEFTDAAEISGWAAEAVYAAQRAGLIQGRETGAFCPQDTATRAEVAAILQRFIEKL